MFPSRFFPLTPGTMVTLIALALGLSPGNHSQPAERRDLDASTTAAVHEQLPVRAEARDADRFVQLKAGTIDTSRPDAATGELPDGPGRHLHLVQFGGAIAPAWVTGLEEAGVDVVAYVPNGAYLVYGDVESLRRVQAAGDALPIRWDAALRPEWKLDSALVGASEKGAVGDVSLVDVQLVADATANAATLALIESLSGEHVDVDDSVPGYVNATARLDAASAIEIAAQADVVAVLAHSADAEMDSDERIEGVGRDALVLAGPGEGTYDVAAQALDARIQRLSHDGAFRSQRRVDAPLVAPVSGGAAVAKSALPAGSAALADRLQDGFRGLGLAAPSPAMTRAALLAASRETDIKVIGADGKATRRNVRVADEASLRAFFDSTAIVLDADDADVFTASGEERLYTGVIADSTQPVHIALAWTDAPGATIGFGPVNDLDLEVVVNGETYAGSSSPSEAMLPAGLPETQSTHESVQLPIGTSGPVAIRVRGRNIGGDGVPGNGIRVDQDFAIGGTNVIMAPSAPVIVPAGSSLVAENCTANNGVLDPGETVTVSLCLRNTGPDAPVDLIATLLEQGGVLSPSAPQSYGPLAPGATVCRNFTFTVSNLATCGSTVTATLSLRDGSTNLGTATFTFTLGVVTTSTSTFSNAAAITINASGIATPYPSNIAVSGMCGLVSKVTMTLNGLNHTFPDDVDMLLVSPSGAKFTPVSDCNGTVDWVNITYTFDDAASGLLADGTGNASGTYRPTNYDTIDTFPAPAPAAPYQFPATAGTATFASTFNGASPNGTWSLYINDDLGGDGGSVTGGWSLTITTSCGTCCAQPKIINPNGSSITAETCTPPNTKLDPGEGVTVSFGLINNGTSSTSNLVATLDATGGVVGPSGPQSYGALAPGGSAARPFTFTVDPTLACGATLTATLRLQDGSTNLGIAVFTFATGTLSAPTTFSNTTPIVIPSVGAATPYPSNITVSGVGTSLSKVTVSLTGLTHTFPADIDMLLVGPAGQKYVIFSDPSTTGVSGINVTLDDAAGGLVPATGVIASGTYRPTNYGTGDTFAGGPASPYNDAATAGAATFASVYNGSNPNGTWSLYVIDDVGGDAGTIAGGWSVTVQTMQCCGGPPVLQAGNKSFISGSCTSPSNSTIDPGETVTVSLCVKNIGVSSTTNLVGTLQSTGGVTAPSGPQTYGVLAPGGAEVCKNFTFTVDPNLACGGTVTASLQLQDGATNFGTVTFTFTSVPIGGAGTTFTNSAPIVINDSAPATPYPSIINVAGAPARIGKVTLTLNGLSHTFPSDIDMLLVGPTGQTVMFLSDAGGGTGITGVNVTFDDAAAGNVPTPIVTGTYKPTDITPGDAMAAPAPAGPYGSTMAGFNNTNPNGTWRLFIVDDLGGDVGTVSGGWSLTIAGPPVCCGGPPQVVDAGSSFVSGSCTPANTSVDPGESVVVNLCLQNLGASATTNLVATLQATGGVTAPGPPQNYGALAPLGGPAVCRNFSFTVDPNFPCGGTVIVTLRLQDGASNLGTVSFPFVITPLATIPGPTYSNPATITIPALGVATPYPSTITVAGAPTSVRNVRASIVKFNHTFPADVDMLLVGPLGQKVMILSDQGGGTDAVDVNITFDDNAATQVPNPIVSGTFRPTDIAPGETMAAPAPVGPYGTQMSAFDGLNPNGTWNLYVQDAVGGDAGNIAGGWSLTFDQPVCCGGPPVMRGSGQTLLTESCGPGNGVLDPDETVTVSLCLSNIGGSNTDDLVATLLPTGGVTAPSGPQNYGVVVAYGPSVCRDFSFTVNRSLPCGSTVTATLALVDDGTPIGTATFQFVTGVNVTNSFFNTTPISIPDSGAGSPYPSTIAVSGVPGNVVKVTATLVRLTHTFPSDIDVLLVGPGGQKVMIMSDAGGGTGVSNVTVTLDDAAGGPVPTPIVTGTFQPTDIAPGETMPPPAPPGPYAAVLSAFNGTNPNGNWNLYVADDLGGDQGQINGGWSITITTAQCCVETPPTCNAGAGGQTECRTIDITGASVNDVNEDEIAYSWSTSDPNVTVSPASGTIPAGGGNRPIPDAVATLGSGANPCDLDVTLTLTVNDGMFTSTCTATLTFDDNTPPDLTGCPADSSLGFECAEDLPPAGIVTARDNCDPDVPVTYTETRTGTEPCNFDVVRTWTASDDCGNTSSCSQTIHIQDVTAPTIDVAPKFLGMDCVQMWPPNHGYAEFSIADLGTSAHDNCIGPVDIRFGRCASSDPEDGTGDGGTEDDCMISPDGGTIAMRVERDANCGLTLFGGGRTYTVDVTYTDQCGNAATAQAKACVSHDRSHPPPGIYVSAEDGSSSSDTRPGWTEGTYGPDCGVIGP